MSPRGKDTNEDGKVPGEYPFKRDLEDLLGSPLKRTSMDECLEDGEIEGTNMLQILATTQVGGGTYLKLFLR